MDAVQQSADASAACLPRCQRSLSSLASTAESPPPPPAADATAASAADNAVTSLILVFDILVDKFLAAVAQ